MNVIHLLQHMWIRSDELPPDNRSPLAVKGALCHVLSVQAPYLMACKGRSHESSASILEASHLGNMRHACRTKQTKLWCDSFKVHIVCPVSYLTLQSSRQTLYITFPNYYLSSNLSFYTGFLLLHTMCVTAIYHYIWCCDADMSFCTGPLRGDYILALHMP